jgi:ABC-type phosphate transport system permease subunit
MAIKEARKMEHRKVSRLLMLAGVIAVLGGGYLFFVDAPMAALRYRELMPEYAYLFIPTLVFLWVIGLIYLAAMADYFRVCRRIGQDRSFCPENDRSLSRIARLLIGAAAIWLLGIPLGLLLGLGIGVWMAVFALAAAASAAMGMLARGLSRLLKRATEMKEENDLTV